MTIPEQHINMKFKMTKLVKPIVIEEAVQEEYDEYITIANSDDNGYISRSSSLWSDCRDELSGDTVWDDLEYLHTTTSKVLVGSYTINRAFFAFNLSNLPLNRGIKYATLQLWGFVFDRVNTTAIVFEGKQDSPLSLSDYSAFETERLSIGLIAGMAHAHLFGFNTEGLIYLQSKLGSLATLCCREYTKDYRDTPPPNEDISYGGSWYSAEEDNADKRPKLIIGF